VSVASRSSEATPSHPDAARLKGPALRAQTASTPQMSGMDVEVEIHVEISHDVYPSSGFEIGLGVQPPHPLLTCFRSHWYIRFY